MKALLFLLTILALPLGLFGQGRIYFRNTATTLITTNVGSASGPMSGIDAFRIGLYIAAPGTTDEGSFTLVALATNSPILPGRFFGGGAGETVLAGNTGETIAFQVRAWTLSAGLGGYESARSTALANNDYTILGGTSAIGTVTPTLVGPIPEIFGTAAGQVGGFVLTPFLVPEPSSIALGVLGLASVLLFRRRKN